MFFIRCTSSLAKLPDNINSLSTIPCENLTYENQSELSVLQLIPCELSFYTAELFISRNVTDSKNLVESKEAPEKLQITYLNKMYRIENDPAELITIKEENTESKPVQNQSLNIERVNSKNSSSSVLALALLITGGMLYTTSSTKQTNKQMIEHKTEKEV